MPTTAKSCPGNCFDRRGVNVVEPSLIPAVIVSVTSYTLFHTCPKRVTCNVCHTLVHERGGS